MNNPATRQQWILEQLTERPTLSYVDCLREFLVVFGKSKTTFDKDWKKAKSKHVKGQTQKRSIAKSAIEYLLKEQAIDNHNLMCEKLLSIINKESIIEEKCYDMSIGKVVVFYREPNGMEQIEAIKEYNRINGI